jgi:protein-disulfide isomerase
MSKNDSRQAKRLAEKEAARRRRTRNILIGAVVAVVAVAGIIAWASNRTETDTTAAMPAGIDSDLGVPVGTASSPVVDIYEDFQCPICKTLEDNVGPALQQLIDSGDVKVVYHIMSFLDNNLGNDSSTRTANAAGCAQDQGVFPAYHAEVFANQPAVEGDGYTDEQLLTFGETAGVEDMDRFRACVSEETFAGWVTQVERRAEDDQISGTPTVLVDGTRVDLGQASSWDDYINQLTTAIQQAG